MEQAEWNQTEREEMRIANVNCLRCRVKAIRVELFCTFIEWDIVAGFVDKSIFGVPVNEIGKTVFLTREEAEKVLGAKKDE